MFERVWAALFVLVISSSVCDAAVELLEFCDHPGVERPARQTIIILDEHHLKPEKGGTPNPANESWRRFVIQLLSVDRTGISRDFLPRERVTILIARHDGGGLKKVATSCLAFFSPNEIAKMAQRRGIMRQVDSFFGWGPKSAAEKANRRLLVAVNGALSSATDISSLSKPKYADSFQDSPLLASLSRSRLVDLSSGIPRILLFSDLSRFSFSGVTETRSARELGLAIGEIANLDLDRSEIYVLAPRNEGNAKIAKEVMHSFFLKSGAIMRSFTGSPTINSLTNNPQSVSVFNGKIEFPSGDKFPVQMRLAVDQNGNSVNSWFQIKTATEKLIPFGGSLSCENEGRDRCSFIGDKIFAQIWTTEPGGEPEFRNDMPLKGLRDFEFKRKGTKVTGSVFDSAAELVSANNAAKDNKLAIEMNKMGKGVIW